MILHGRNPEALFPQDFISSLDLGQIVVGYAHILHLAALQQRDKFRRPTFHICRIVNPVQVDYINAQALTACLCHLCHGVLVHACDLRRELGGDDDRIFVTLADKSAQDVLRGPHAVNRGRIPEIQPPFHGRIKNRLQITFSQMIAKHLVPAGNACSPGPGTHSNLRHSLISIHKCSSLMNLQFQNLYAYQNFFACAAFPFIHSRHSGFVIYTCSSCPLSARAISKAVFFFSNTGAGT